MIDIKLDIPKRFLVVKGINKRERFIEKVNLTAREAMEQAKAAAVKASPGLTFPSKWDVREVEGNLYNNPGTRGNVIQRMILSNSSTFANHATSHTKEDYGYTARQILDWLNKGTNPHLIYPRIENTVGAISKFPRLIFFWKREGRMFVGRPGQFVRHPGHKAYAFLDAAREKLAGLGRRIKEIMIDFVMRRI